jgi:hypothetical protein
MIITSTNKQQMSAVKSQFHVALSYDLKEKKIMT